jgi:alanine-synthesizing transaminase
MSPDDKMIRISDSLRNVRYEIRGKLARRALEMSRKGYEIISLNIGNPALFGFRTPETMRLAMIENFPESEGYCHQKGIFPAREAVVMQQQARDGCFGRRGVHRQWGLGAHRSRAACDVERRR